MLSSPAMVLRRVDFPQPEGPTSTRKPSSSIARLMSFSTSTAPNLFSRCSISRNAMRLPFHRAGHQAADEIAAGNDVDDERRKSGQDRPRKVNVVLLDAGRRAHEVVERDGHRH